MGSKGMTEQQYQEYLRMQRRARRGMEYGGRPTLSSQRDYYLRMAEDPAASPRERKQWRLLASEMTKRLGNAESAREAQTELPFG